MEILIQMNSSHICLIDEFYFMNSRRFTNINTESSVSQAQANGFDCVPN